MNNTSQTIGSWHPAEDSLERYLLNRASDPESEKIELHFLACAPCVERLEALENEICSLKAALQSLQSEDQQTILAKASKASVWHNWFSLPKITFAGMAAATACAVGLLFSPASIQDIALSPDRGIDVRTVPAQQVLRLHLAAPNVNDGPVSIAVVQADGHQIWASHTVAKDHAVIVTIPKLATTGTHFVQLYTAGADSSEIQQQEYSLQVK
jgi:hypothetical protein